MIKRVRIFDNQRKNLRDELTAGDKRPRGYVEIFDKKTGEKITESDNVTFPVFKGPNLIVYSGRTWLMQRAFNQDLNVGSDRSSSYISWFSLGTGGATSGDPLNPISPTPIDVGMNIPAIINAADPECVDNGYLHPIDSIVYEQDITNDNQYLIAKASITISTSDANGATGTTYYDLSEAGLWISNSKNPVQFNPNSKVLFARVTYSTIRKHSEREIVFIWSIYF